MKHHSLVALITSLVSIILVVVVCVLVFSKANTAGAIDSIAKAFNNSEVSIRSDIHSGVTVYESLYKENTTKDRIRNIFENYTDANSNLLKESMTDYLLSNSDVKEGSKDKYADTVGVYVESLFSGIAELKRGEASEEAVEEFVTNESDAFDWLYAYVVSILKEKYDYDPKGEDLVKMYDCTARSTCAYNALKKLSENENTVSAFMGAYGKISDKAKLTVNATSAEYLGSSAEGTKEFDVVSYCAKLFGLNL